MTSEKLNQACIDRELDLRFGFLFAASIVNAGNELTERQRFLYLIWPHVTKLIWQAVEALLGIPPIQSTFLGRPAVTDFDGKDGMIAE